MQAPSEQDLYGDASATEPTSDQTDSESDTGGETALLPKSILEGQELKPGDEITLKIVRFHDKEVEVMPTGSGEEEQEGEEPSMESETPASTEPGAPPPESGGGGGMYE